MDERYCEMCGIETICEEFSVKYMGKTITNHSGVIHLIACKRCAEDMCLKHSEELEKENKIWWRKHLSERTKRELSEEEFAWFYNNRILYI